MQFTLRLVFFPQLRSIDASKPRSFFVPQCFPPLLVLTGDKSAEPRFQRRLRETGDQSNSLSRESATGDS
jgi:hypothetical protein